MSRGSDNYDPEALSHLRPSSSSPAYWLDELGHFCPKTVDYGMHCPKGHDLVAFSGRGLGGEVSAHCLMCRICHSQTEKEHASSWLVCTRAGSCATYAVCERCVGELVHPRSENIGDGFGDDFPRLGVTVPYVLWMRNTLGSWMGHLNAEQVFHMVIKPRTSRSLNFLANELLLRADTRDHVGEATWFVSHCWKSPNAFVETLDAILLFFEKREEESARLWIDMFVLSQHDFPGIVRRNNSNSWYMASTRSTVSRIGRLVLVVDNWNSPTALRRAWCLLELHAIAVKKAEGGGEFEVAMTAAEMLRFLRCCNGDIKEYHKMLGVVNVETGAIDERYSDCSFAADLKQHYKMFGTASAFGSSHSGPDDFALHDGAPAGNGFGPSELVARLLQEWLEVQLRDLALTSASD